MERLSALQRAQLLEHLKTNDFDFKSMPVGQLQAHLCVKQLLEQQKFLAETGKLFNALYKAVREAGYTPTFSNDKGRISATLTRFSWRDRLSLWWRKHICEDAAKLWPSDGGPR